MATDKMLKKTAVELNDVMGLNPPINTKLPAEDLTKMIKAAMKHITEEDEFSDGVQEVLDELKPKGKKEVAPPPAPAKKKAPVVVEEDDDDEDEEIEVEDEEVEVAPVKKGKKAPVIVEDDDDEDEDDEPVKPAKKGKAAPAEKEKKEKKAFTRAEYNRLDCVLITLKEKKPKTIADWIAKANALHVAKGGKDNEAQTKHLVINYGASLKYLDLGGITVPSK